MRDREKRTLTVVIENVTEAQEIALGDLFATWATLGSWGSSRWTGFYADGDGDFRPKITVNGEKARHTDLLPREQMWKEGGHGEYRIDFDWVGWKLAEAEERENSCTAENPDRSKRHHDWPDRRSLAPGWEETLACNNCGLPWKESALYRPPADWSKPHHFMAPDGWDSRACPDCGKDYDDPVHIGGEASEDEKEG